MELDPTDCLQRLRIALEAGTPIPDDVAAWLALGVDEFTESGRPLCSALGLRQPGQRSVATRAKMLERDAALAVAGSLVEGSVRWRRATVLGSAIVRFQDAWPRIQRRPAIALPPLRQALAAAHKPGIRVPRSPQRLLRFV